MGRYALHDLATPNTVSLVTFSVLLEQRPFCPVHTRLFLDGLAWTCRWRYAAGTGGSVAVLPTRREPRAIQRAAGGWIVMEMPEFEVSQTYETAIVMRARGGEPDREFRFICVPAAAIHEDNRPLLNDPETLLSEFGLAKPKELRVAQLPDAIFVLLKAEDLGELAGQDAGSALDLASSSEWLTEHRDADPDAGMFADYLALAEVVPFEHPKLGRYALTSVAMRGYEQETPGAEFDGIARTPDPHWPVAYLTTLVASSLAVVVVGRVGIVVGMVSSHETAAVIETVRHRIRQLVQRPDSPRLYQDDQSVPSPEASGISEADQASPSVDALVQERGMKLLELLAEAAAPEDGKPSWVNRRIEQVEFLDTRAVRWRTSIDFVVPPDAPEVQIGAEDARLVPVTTMPKRPLVSFDLRDEDEKAMCLPTSEETGGMIGAALVWVATFNLNRPRLPSGLDEDLRKIVTAGPGEYETEYAPFATAAALIDVNQCRKDLHDVSWRSRKKFTLRHLWAWYKDQRNWTRDWNRAQKTLAGADQSLWHARQGLASVAECPNCSKYGVDGPPGATLKTVEPSECRRCTAYELMGNQDVRNQVEVLAQDFIVCVAVADPPGTRRIVKLSSEQPISFWTHNGMCRRLGQLLGLVCWPFDILIGGRGGSHHLEVAAPPGVDVVRITTQPAVRRRPGPPPHQTCGLSPHVHTVVPATPPIRYLATTFVRTSSTGLADCFIASGSPYRCDDGGWHDRLARRVPCTCKGTHCGFRGSRCGSRALAGLARRDRCLARPSWRASPCFEVARGRKVLFLCGRGRCSGRYWGPGPTQGHVAAT